MIETKSKGSNIYWLLVIIWTPSETGLWVWVWIVVWEGGSVIESLDHPKIRGNNFHKHSLSHTHTQSFAILKDSQSIFVVFLLFDI